MRKFFASFPAWTASVVWILLILWTMDVLSPLMEDFSDVFIFWDKFCHLLLGAVMVFCLCLDWQRRRKWRQMKPGILFILALIGSVITATAEVCQIFTPEEYRRWFDPLDVAWQLIGAFGMTALYSALQLLWCKPNPLKKVK